MRIQLAPGVPDWASLGIADGTRLLAGDAPALDRVRRISSEAGFEALRFALPGTPDATGRLTARPGGAGTGFAVLRRFTGAGFAPSWRARFTTPRSLSLAEREWNLLCHLRRHGVGTPEPLAVGSEGGAVFGRRSFLIVRELDDLEPLAERWRSDLSTRERARIARALGATLDRVFRCGVVLPHLDVHAIWIGKPRHDAQPCAAQQIAALRDGVPLAFGRLPEIAIVDVRGGSLSGRIRSAQRARVLDALCDSMRVVDRVSLLRLAARALPHAEKRAWLARRSELAVSCTRPA